MSFTAILCGRKINKEDGSLKCNGLKLMFWDQSL